MAVAAAEASNPIAAAGEQALDEVEQLLEQVVREGRDFTDAELVRLRSLGLGPEVWAGGERVLSRERQRVKRRLTLEKQAGTPQRRGQLRSKADEAREAADERLPAIAEQIAALQREQRQLEQARDQAEEAAKAAEDAAAALDDPKHLPRHKRKAWSAQRSEIHQRHEAEIKPLRQRVEGVRKCASLEIETVYDSDFPWAVKYCEQNNPDVLIIRGDDSVVEKNIHLERFGQWQEQLRGELPALEQDLAEAEQARADEIAQAWEVFRG